MPLPYLRFGIVVIALFLVARILLGLTLKAAAEAARLAVMPYQRGQFRVCRFRQEAQKLCAAPAAFIAPPEAPDFASRALQMLESIGWIARARKSPHRQKVGIKEEDDEADLGHPARDFRSFLHLNVLRSDGRKGQHADLDSTEPVSPELM